MAKNPLEKLLTTAKAYAMEGARQWAGRQRIKLDETLTALIVDREMPAAFQKAVRDFQEAEEVGLTLWGKRGFQSDMMMLGVRSAKEAHGQGTPEA